jgi:hypothetical protein
MELIEIDTIEVKPFQATLDSLAKMIGTGVVRPSVRRYATVTALGSDYKILGIGCQCFDNNFFSNRGAVRISGVDKVHFQVQRPPQ